MTWQGQWPPHKVTLSRTKLISLIETVSNLAHDAEDEVQQALSRFLVIRSCGHIEVALEECFCVGAEDKSAPHVGRFVRKQFSRGRNPTPERIGQILEVVSSGSASTFKSKISENDELLKRQLELLVDRRNRIAHGENEGLGRVKALELARASVEIADWVTQALRL